MRNAFFMCFAVIISGMAKAQTFIHFTITQDPVVTADAGTGSIICDGAFANLTGTAGGGNGSYSYQWAPSGPVTDPLNNITTANPTVTTTFTLTVTDGNQCSEVSTVMVTLPVSPLSVDAGTNVNICPGSLVNLLGSVSGGYGSYNYLWTPGPTLNDSTISNPIANPLSNITYQLQITDSNNCIKTDSVTVNIIDCSGIENLSANGFIIYPNSNNGIFNLLINDHDDGSAVSIFTLQGTLIYQRELIGSANYLIQLDQVASGVYLLVLNNGDGNIYSQKLIIQ